MLVPEVAAGAAPELDDLRAACDAAIAHLSASAADALVIIGTGPATGELPPPYGGSFAPWGVRLDVGAAVTEPLPLSLLMGAWLCERAEWPTDARRMISLAPVEAPAECVRLGAAATRGKATAVLVMGDGSARRGVKAPGYDDPRAEPFDATVAAALAKADREALLALDPGLAAELMAVGRAPWQALAGAADDGREWRGDLLYADAPYGVGYAVATWTPG
jgi:hypothetical protein